MRLTSLVVTACAIIASVATFPVDQPSKNKEAPNESDAVNDVVSLSTTATLGGILPRLLNVIPNTVRRIKQAMVWTIVPVDYGMSARDMNELICINRAFDNRKFMVGKSLEERRRVIWARCREDPAWDPAVELRDAQHASGKQAQQQKEEDKGHEAGEEDGKGDSDEGTGAAKSPFKVTSSGLLRQLPGRSGLLSDAPSQAWKALSVGAGMLMSGNGLRSMAY